MRPSGEKERKLRPQQITIQQHFVTNFCDLREKSILTQSQAKLRAPPVVVALSQRRGELRVEVQIRAEVGRKASAVSLLGDSMGRGLIFRPASVKMYFLTPKCICRTQNAVFNRFQSGTRIWDHAKMRGSGAWKIGLERKPGLVMAW